jgi:hypothetical protein
MQQVCYMRTRCECTIFTSNGQSDGQSTPWFNKMADGGNFTKKQGDGINLASSMVAPA